MTALVATLAVVVGLLAVLVVGILRSHAEILRALHELGLNDVLDPDAPATSETTALRTRPGVSQPRVEGSTEASDLIGVTLDGGSAKVAVHAVQHTTLLAFLSSGCLTCAGFWEAFGEEDARRLPGADTRLVIITKSPDHESLSRVRELAPAGVATIMSTQAWDDYDVPVSPYFLLVDGPSGSVIGEGAAATWDQVSSLLHQAAADAGLDTSGGSTPASRARGRSREGRTDDELAAAGIMPGDPSLYLDAPSSDVAAESELDR